MTNQERAAEVVRDAYDKPHWSPMHRCDNIVQDLDDAGLLISNPPEQKWPGYWEVDGLGITIADKDGEVNLEWRDGDYYNGEDRSLWLNRKQVLAIIAAANLAKEQK